MSEAELSEDQLKEQKLEAAKKKYEELKKKNKKKKNKKKNADTKEDSVEPEGDEMEKDDDDEKTEESEEAKNELDETKEDIKNDDKATKEETGVPEVKQAEVQQIVEEKRYGESKEDAAHIESKADDSSHANEELKIDASEVKEEVQSTLIPVDTVAKEKEKLSAKSQSESQQVDSLFGGDSGPSFLETIKDSKLQDEIKILQTRNTELTKENESLKKDIKALKLEKFDRIDQIETLEQRVKNLEAKLAKAKVDHPQQSHYQEYDDENLSLSPSPSYQHQPFDNNYTHFNQLEKTTVADIKAKLNKWKGWNLDMTSWRSIGSGPILEL